MAIDPNQIDISLSLLPGESEQVLSDLIEIMQEVAGQMTAIANGKEFAPVGNTLPSKGVTRSDANDVVSVHIASVSPTASLGVPAGAVSDQQWSIPGDSTSGGMVMRVPVASPGPDGESQARTRAKLGAAARTEEAPTEEMGPVGQPSTPPDVVLPDAPIEEEMEKGRFKRRFEQARESLTVRHPPNEEQKRAGELGEANRLGTLMNLGQIGLTARVLGMGNGQGAIADEKEQLKSSFMPGNLESLGTELGGTQAPSARIPGLGIEGVIPGTPLVQAVLGRLGNDKAKESAGYKGMKAELDSLWKGFKDPYVSQGEARQIGHGVIGKGFNKQDVEEAQDDFSKMRDRTKGMPAIGAKDFVEMRTQALREGGESLETLNQAVTDLPGAAQAARMGIEEFTASVISVAESMTTEGATYAQAVEAVGSFSASTGLAPQVMQAVKASPMVKGDLYSKGFDEATIGQASGGMVAKSMAKSARELYDTFEPGYQDITEETEAGTITTTKEDQAIARVANELTVSKSTAEKMLNQEEYTDEAATATDYIDQSAKTSRELHDKYGGDKEKLAEVREKMRTGVGAPKDAITRPEVIKQMRKAGVDEKTLKEVEGAGSATDFRAAAKLAIEEQTKAINEGKDEEGKGPKKGESINDKVSVSVDLKMKGVAARMFEDLKVDADAYREANKARNTGKATHKHHNPRGLPPAKSMAESLKDKIFG